jgi:hypothetical protein
LDANLQYFFVQLKVMLDNSCTAPFRAAGTVRHFKDSTSTLLLVRPAWAKLA